MEKKQLYRQLPWSLQNYILSHWYFWIVLLFIFLGSISLFYKLSANSYFSHEMVDEKKATIKILAFRSDIFTTVLVTNPYDNDKPYEIDLGYFCKANQDLLNKNVNMTSSLYRRNYNKTFFVSFPQARTTICKK